MSAVWVCVVGCCLHPVAAAVDASGSNQTGDSRLSQMHRSTRPTDTTTPIPMLSHHSNHTTNKPYAPPTLDFAIFRKFCSACSRWSMSAISLLASWNTPPPPPLPPALPPPNDAAAAAALASDGPPAAAATTGTRCSCCCRGEAAAAAAAAAALYGGPAGEEGCTVVRTTPAADAGYTRGCRYVVKCVSAGRRQMAVQSAQEMHASSASMLRWVTPNPQPPHPPNNQL